MSLKLDPQIYTGAPADAENRIDAEKRAYAFLSSLGIEYLRADHEHTDTIEACAAIEKLLDVHVCKNLFLCNRQATQFYLLMMPGHKSFRTGTVSKILGVSRLSFASAENMERLLGLQPGSVTVLGLLNDTGHQVQLVIDADVLREPYIGCHPCISTSSLKIRTADLMERILPALGVTPRIVELPDGE
ncbi:MAG: prolyl-tRNA synthetase associated domain-containing protein [Candidatus Heteroscillospira sp.]